MKHFFISLLAVIIGEIILLILPIIIFVAIVIAIAEQPEEPAIEPNSVLYYNISTPLAEREIDDPAMIFYNALYDRTTAIGLPTIIENIEKAAVDSNIVGIVLEGYTGPTSFTNAREIRTALQKFRETGKFVYYYEQAADRNALYVASVADKVFVSPEGYALLNGLQSTSIFYKGLIDKLDVDVEIFRHGKFKSAVEPYMLKEMSDASREQTQRYVDVLWETMRSEIAKSRNIGEKTIDVYADKLDFASTANSIKLGIVDDVLYSDQFLDFLKDKLSEETIDDIQSVEMNNYTSVDVASHKTTSSDNTIAVVYAYGEIYDGSDATDYDNIYSYNLAETLRDARLDDDVKAIVLRVNSPGGSALAADQIWREVKLAADVKPVVVSMGQYAASGGYYISCAANYIYAHPSTLTGSIGVFGVAPNFGKTADKYLGVTFDEVRSNAEGMPTGFSQLTPLQCEFFQQSVENCYDTFITRCAEGRNMSKKRIDEIAQGRVWAGVDAKRLGLIDDFGSLNDAIAKAAELAGIDNYKIEELPEIETSISSILKGLGLDAKAFVGKMFFGSAQSKLRELEQTIEKPTIKARMECDYMIQ